MKKHNFTTMGTFGDTIYSMCLMKMLGGGDLYVKLDAIDDFIKNVVGWPDAGEAAGRYTAGDYQFIAPLLQAQDYLDHVAIWKDEPDDYPQLPDHWKFHIGERWAGNQTECYALALGMDIHDPGIKTQLLYEPWLTELTPLKVPGRPVVINRTHRHLVGSDGAEWGEWIKNGLSSQAAFIGTDQEHAAFEEQFQQKFHHQKITDALEMARYIQGCEQFIGNQSLALSIAIGSGKTYWCEIREDYESTKTPHGGYGDVWFPRINGFYF